MDENERDLLLQFLWTRDHEDTIDTTEKLRAWLLGLGLIEPSEPVSDDDVRRTRHFRAATRALCASNNGAPLDPRTQQTFNELNAIAPLQVTVGPRGELAVQPGGSGVSRALSGLLAIGYKATITGEFSRFKACKGCGWPYYDETKNLSKMWCDVGACGAKSKMRAYRARKKAAHG